MDKEKISLDQAEESLAAVTSWFQQKDVVVPGKPRLQIADEPCLLLPNAAAICVTDIESSKHLAGIIGSTHLKAMNMCFGLHVSDEALQESIQVTMPLLEQEWRKYFPWEADIVLFPGAQRFKEEDRLNELMSHEVWHFVEREHDIVFGDGMSHEGTATYVQNQFAGRTSEETHTDSHSDVLYKRAAHLVEQVVGRFANPIPQILTQSVRTEITSLCMNVLIPELKESIIRSREEVLASKEPLMRHLIRTHIDYEEFRRTRTIESVLNMLSKRGNVKLADECREQDTSALLEFYLRMLDTEPSH